MYAMTLSVSEVFLQLRLRAIFIMLFLLSALVLPAGGAEKKPNRLIKEKSPYLLKHAYNPVDWYPWGEEAFRRAREEDRPVYLSIGYTACHWCNVMEEESFSDPEVAALMNEAFVSVKVDREERPDLDTVYMTVSQMLTGGGGWPLTIIMTPEKKPFFAGTYFPKHSRFGRMGMMELVPRVKELWEKDRVRLIQQAETVTDNLRKVTTHEKGSGLEEKHIHGAFERLKKNYDARYGGFGTGVKFPSPHTILFLLRYWHRTGNDDALKMARGTLKGMRHGGIFDHLGFGFHRYSTDRAWLVPHFEKMLYDQALHGMAYTHLCVERPDGPRRGILRRPGCRLRGRGGQVLSVGGKGDPCRPRHQAGGRGGKNAAGESGGQLCRPLGGGQNGKEHPSHPGGHEPS
jgi:uncharacterized protein YyaL (SSP411 family)